METDISLRVITAIALISTLLAGPVEADTRADAEGSEGSQVVLDDDFSSLNLGPDRTWGWQSSAYSTCTTNPGHWKLDRLTESALSTDAGYLTVTARPAADGQWDTGLLTTGDSCDSGGTGAEVRAGDLLIAHVRLPEADSGSWPGLWTWRDGQNEMDVFEWHADFPTHLEFANHVKSIGQGYIYSGPEVGAERWLWIGAKLGADSVAWYVGTDLDHLVCPYADRTGVGADFAAYPILNLAIDDGNFRIGDEYLHPAPTGTRPVTLGADRMLILHPAPADLPAPAVVADQPG